MYGYGCEFCEGTVEERLVKKEVFKHKNGFVMLENVPVGICDKGPKPPRRRTRPNARCQRPMRSWRRYVVLRT